MDPRANNDSNDPLDPFASLDAQRTFIRPTPGGRAARPATGVSRAAADAATDLPVTEHGLNPLLALANRLLLAVPQIRATRQLADPAELRNTLAQGLRDLSAQAAARGATPEQVMAARYVLCTVLDEAASDTPWGGSGAWASYSLLVMFHNENYGGEKVFRLMARLAEDPARNCDLLELIYAALALGFEGRYRIIENGAVQLDAVRDRLAQIIRQQRGDHPAALAQHWQVPAQRQRRALSWLPLLATLSVVGLVLLLLHLGLSAGLSNQSDPVFAQIQSLRLTPPLVATAQAAVPPPAAPPRLAQFLQSDIQAGLVAVRDEADRSIVTLRGDGLFEPGSANLASSRDALLARIGDALAKLGGTVLVTGHTDSQPIRSARFPSNWHLSEARARSVRELLIGRQVAPERLRAEGRADAEPLAANDTPANRALNRRVEITLLVAGGANAAPPITPAGQPASQSGSAS
jgi:type VI secretion system protein ImpK